MPYGLSIEEFVNADRMWASNGDPIAVTDRYWIALKIGFNYEPLFVIGGWRNQMLGWKGQRLTLSEEKMIPSFLNYIDQNLPLNSTEQPPNDY